VHPLRTALLIVRSDLQHWRGLRAPLFLFFSRVRESAASAMEARVRMPLGANVPRRRPAADASSFISPPRAFAPAFRLARRSPVQSGKAGLLLQACDPQPGAAGRPSGQMSSGIRLRRMPPPWFCPEGLPAAPGPSDRDEACDP